jgi:positive regulator of sigma E activity
MAAPQRIVLATPLTVRVGDSVVVALSDRQLLLASLLVHGLPLAALLAGALLGVAIVGSDAGGAGGAVAGVVAALVAAPRLRRHLERDTLRRVEVRPGAPRAHTHSL